MNQDKDIQLAMAVAVDKELHQMLQDLKADNAQAMAEQYEEFRSTQRALMIGDEQVGLCSFIKPSNKIIIKPGNEDGALDVLAKLNLTEESPKKGWESSFTIVAGNVIDCTTGEDMSEYFEVVRKPGYAMVRGCEFDQVNEAIKKTGLATSLVAGLFDKGEEK